MSSTQKLVIFSDDRQLPLACLLGKDEGDKTPTKAGNSPVKRSADEGHWHEKEGEGTKEREERGNTGANKAGNAGEKDAEENKEKDSGKECPKYFEKVSEQLCLHYNETKSNFKVSKAYCQRKAVESELFGFTDSKEASKVWDWLGRYGINVLLNTIFC